MDPFTQKQKGIRRQRKQSSFQGLAGRKGKRGQVRKQRNAQWRSAGQGEGVQARAQSCPRHNLPPARLGKNSKTDPMA